MKPIPQTWFNKVGSKEISENKKSNKQQKNQNHKDRKRETHGMQTTGKGTELKNILFLDMRNKRFLCSIAKIQC